MGVETGKGGGRPTKDAPISDNFNAIKLGATATKKEIATAKRLVRMERQRQEASTRKQQEELVAVSNRLAKIGKKVGIVTEDEDPESTLPEDATTAVGISKKSAPDPDAQDADDLKSAYQMLQDMRWVYRNVKGRKKLLELVKEDDKQFVFMVKELMKIESSLMAAKIRKNEEPGSPGQRNFFVILKGLEDEKKYLPIANTDKTVDISQVQRAINPDLGEVYDAEEVEEVSQRDAPEQLHKSVSSVEDW